MKRKIIDEKMEVIQRDDQVYVYKALKNSTIELETVKKMTILGDEWNGDALCANLLDIREVLFIDSKARKYGAGLVRPHVAGQAILIESRFSKYFANILFRFSNPKIPTRVFTNEHEAIKWLQNCINKKSL